MSFVMADGAMIKRAERGFRSQPSDSLSCTGTHVHKCRFFRFIGINIERT
jgi:hypothetical protein